ncbi:hypothetical protein GLP59_06605 [Sulfitobacter sp. M220]|uniref:hypothetical protein n=1 Tax=unclassified Sulfitobacter TaxID=196795 RepID=UPI000A529A95|nr:MULTISPECIES: hypothetical protein [unclassified Sulfitobacter]MCF7777324.1 hypothetical protein [Sulfitobacter sp. M220]ULO18903.1 hypothetical protein IV89_001885 [Sulfitobacter sp. CB2047]
MTNVQTHVNAMLTPSDQVEKIAQLALVGQAALNTNLTDPHVGEAVATLLQVITDISDDLLNELQQQDAKTMLTKAPT